MRDMPDPAQIRPPMQWMPAPLQRLMKALERMQSPDQVWHGFVGFCSGIGIGSVEYLWATDPCYSARDAMRSTHEDGWSQTLCSQQDLMAQHPFRRLGAERAAPVVFGAAYFNDPTPEAGAEAGFAALCARHGVQCGLAIPLPGLHGALDAMIVLGSEAEPEGFERLLSEHGQTLLIAAMHMHNRHMMLLRQERMREYDLTPKQSELLVLVGEGLMDKMISHKLGISVSAVRQRLNAVQAKTGTKSRAELAALAVSAGLCGDPLNRAAETPL